MTKIKVYPIETDDHYHPWYFGKEMTIPEGTVLKCDNYREEFYDKTRGRATTTDLHVSVENPASEFTSEKGYMIQFANSDIGKGIEIVSRVPADEFAESRREYFDSMVKIAQNSVNELIEISKLKGNSKHPDHIAYRQHELEKARSRLKEAIRNAREAIPGGSRRSSRSPRRSSRSPRGSSSGSSRSPSGSSRTPRGPSSGSSRSPRRRSGTGLGELAGGRVNRRSNRYSKRK